MKADKYFKFEPKETQIFIELGSNFIKLASLKLIKKKKTFSLIRREVASGDEDSFAAQIKEALSAYDLADCQVNLIIPRYLTMARFLNLPSVSEDEIKDMVSLEALKQIPYRAEDVVVSYRIIKKTANGYSDVLFVATENSNIKRLLDILKKAKIEPAKASLSSEGLLAWYYKLRRNSKIDYSDSTALVNIDSEYIDINILDREKLKFSRGFLYSTETQDKCCQASDEIKKSLVTYQRQSDRHLNKLVITGAQDKVEQLRELLKIELDIIPEFISQIEALEIKPIPETDLAAVSFVAPLGLALNSQEAKINLLPRAVIERSQRKRFQKDLNKVLVLLLCVFLVSGVIFAKQIFDKGRYLRILDSKLADIAPEVGRAKAMRENIRVIRTEIEKRPLAIEVFTEIYKAAPVNVKLNLLDYKSGKFLLLRGGAPSLNEVIGFVSKLDESKYFENVRIRYTSERKASQRKTIDFEIIGDLSESY